MTKPPEAITELLARLDAAEADAARYRWVRHRVSGHGSHIDHQHFGFPTSLALRPVGDLMKGSVSQHLDAAIDAARAKGGASVVPACPVCNQQPTFTIDRRVNEWSGFCKHCGVEGSPASSEAEARRLWVAWHHKRHDQ